jgi:hypothetical protein
LGSKKKSNERFLRDENFCWNPGIFRILGVLFSVNIETMVDRNYEGKVMCIKKDLVKWSKRQLTPLGKITVLKSLILSKLTFLCLNLPDPSQKVIKEVENEMFLFLWDGKPAKIKRSVVCKCYNEGGIQMDIKTCIAALKLSWLNRIYNGCTLQKFVFDIFPMFVNLQKFGAEYVHVCLRNCHNSFWRDVLKHYKKLCSKCCPENLTDFMSECIHYNENILRDGKVVNVKEWVSGDVLFVHQLFNYEAKRFFFFLLLMNLRTCTLLSLIQTF